MRQATAIILFWLAGIHHSTAMLAILRATYFLKYNNNENNEIFFAENDNDNPVQEQEKKVTASVYTMDGYEHRVLQSENIFEDVAPMSLSMSMPMTPLNSDVPSMVPLTFGSDTPSTVPATIRSDTPSIVPSTFRSDTPSLVPSIVPSATLSDRPSLAHKECKPVTVVVVEPPTTTEPMSELTMLPVSSPVAIVPGTINPTESLFIISSPVMDPTLSPNSVQVVTKVTLEKSNDDTGSHGVSNVGTAFIVFGAVVAGIVLGGMYLKRRRHRRAIAAAAAQAAAGGTGSSTMGETSSTSNFSTATTVVA